MYVAMKWRGRFQQKPRSLSYYYDDIFSPQRDWKPSSECGLYKYYIFCFPQKAIHYFIVSSKVKLVQEQEVLKRSLITDLFIPDWIASSWLKGSDMFGSKKAPTWREALAEKMALVESIDNNVNVKTDQLDQDFDLIAIRHDHESWLDTFHQRLAREEMNIREQESVLPVLHEKIVQHEKNLVEHNVVLNEMYGDKLKEQQAKSSPKRQQTHVAALDYVMEGWLTEATALHRRKFYKLAPVSSTAPVRLYGFESDIAKSPVSIVQIPKKSAVTFNSATKVSSVSIVIEYSYVVTLLATYCYNYFCYYNYPSIYSYTWNNNVL